MVVVGTAVVVAAVVVVGAVVVAVVLVVVVVVVVVVVAVVVVVVGEVVVTQPAAGDFKAFSAVCTHSGCLINKVADGTIICPCHGSKFCLDAEVVNGPASRPLNAEAITVQGDSILLACVACAPSPCSRLRTAGIYSPGSSFAWAGLNTLVRVSRIVDGVTG